MKKHVIGASLTGLALALTPLVGGSVSAYASGYYGGLDDYALNRADVNKAFAIGLAKCDMDGATQIKWGVSQGQGTTPKTWTTVKNEVQTITYTPKSAGHYAVWAYCADSAGKQVSDDIASHGFEAYSTTATLSSTTWKSGEKVSMVTEGFHTYDVLLASLVRDGDTKDYGDLLNSYEISVLLNGNAGPFVFPSNVPVGNYTLKLTDHDGFVRSVRVHLDHGAGRLLSGSASGSKSPAKPGSKSSSKPGSKSASKTSSKSKSASKTSSKSKSASKATSGKHVVTSGSGAATEKTTTGAASGYDEGASHVSSGMHTLPHTGV